MPEPRVITTTPASVPVARAPQDDLDKIAEIRTCLESGIKIMERALGLLGAVVEDQGCLHEDRIDVSTMGKMRKFYCQDCDDWFEEAWGDVEI